MMKRLISGALLAGLWLATPCAYAQENREQEAAMRRTVLAGLPKNAARRYFGAATTAAPGDPRIIGEYWKGCYTGGLQLPVVGNHWQVMRTSRGRNWGHPRLITYLEWFANRAAEVTGWPGILIGDMAQPRGGPMLTGHASHQLGIEADIWLRPMPKRRFDKDEVEEEMSTDLLRADRKDVDPEVYTIKHLALIRLAAQSHDVARVFVNAAIKKALCRDAVGEREWLQKVRPVLGHTYHFHIRLACPPGETTCKDQDPPVKGEGCSPKDLAYWLTDSMTNWKPSGAVGRAIALTSMPKACQEIAPKEPLTSASAAAPAPAPAPAQRPKR
jgi:penicillin-insensitive murein DD-endopeptidase